MERPERSVKGLQAMERVFRVDQPVPSWRRESIWV